MEADDDRIPPTPLLPPWTLRIRVLFNSVTWRAVPLVLGIPVTLIAIWVGFLATWTDALVLVVGLNGFFVVLWAVSCAIIDLTGGLQVSYLLSTEGVHFATGRGARAAAGATAVAGALAGAAGVTGAGLLALAEQEATLTWQEIRRFRIVERARYVEVRAGLLSKPIGIYCSPENFEAVREIVRSRVPPRP